MELEFDCPQFYDFENGNDVSNPEAYFEEVHDISPTSKTVPWNSKPQKTPLSTVNCEPYKCTRSSAKKSQPTEGLKQTISSLFRSRSQPPVKKTKVMSESTQHASKIPSKVDNGKRVTRANRENKCPPKLDEKPRARPSKRPLTRTVPEPFLFATEKRLKPDTADKTEYKAFDYAATLRRGIEKAVRTIPERLLRKRKVNETVAEPTKPALSSKAAGYHNVTFPVTPNLRTALRSRPVNQEKKPDVKVAPKTLAPVFKIWNPVGQSKSTLTAKLAALRPRPIPQKGFTEFKARPVPKRIFQGVTGLKVRAQVKPTEAHSPTFVLKKRAEAWKHHEAKDVAEMDKKSTQLRSHFMTSNVLKDVSGVPLPAKKREQVKSHAEVAAKVKETRQKTALNQDSKITAEVKNRALNKASEWQKKMEEEMKRQREALLFKARPCTVTRMKPFQPVKSNKAPTKTSGFQFQSDMRLQQRKKGHETEQNVEENKAPEPKQTASQESDATFPNKSIKKERVSVSNTSQI